jgi:hypothetical protein
MKQWKGFHKYLFLEMNFDNIVPKDVDVTKIGGFCIDLSHFKASEEKWSKDFEYILKNSKTHRFFKCNHINGYSYKENRDIHDVSSIKEFEYIKTLPRFIFGDIIAIEMYNNIKDQIRYKEHLKKILEIKLR